MWKREMAIIKIKNIQTLQRLFFDYFEWVIKCMLTMKTFRLSTHFKEFKDFKDTRLINIFMIKISRLKIRMGVLYVLIGACVNAYSYVHK